MRGLFEGTASQSRQNLGWVLSALLMTLAACKSSVPTMQTADGGIDGGVADSGKGMGARGSGGSDTVTGGAGVIVQGGTGGDAGATTIEPSIATQGTACTKEGAFACAGHDDFRKLACSSGQWTLTGTCDGNNRCDPQPGSTEGTCQAIPPECVGKDPGDPTCQGTARMSCDADLLRLEAFDCPANAHCDASASVTCVCDSGYQDDGGGGCISSDNCASVCTADYPCVHLNSFYTCRGQFPDWPNVGNVGPYTTSDGIVTDGKTGLQWQQTLPATYSGCSGNRSTAGDTCSWEEAKAYCTGLSLSGTGWRLPTKAELESIVDDTVYNSAIDTSVFQSTQSDDFWTSSPYVALSGRAWYVNFYYGFTGFITTSTSDRVRCVR